MTRRTRSSPLDDLLDVASLLPWWLGLLLAAVSYAVLSHLASQPIAVTPQNTHSAVTQTFVRSLAAIGQWLLPAIFIVGAGVSVARRRARLALATEVTHNPSSDALNGLSWQQFEQLVGESFRQRGYTVTETGGGGADGGVDLVLRKGGETFLVQCKQWRAYKVGVDVVRELYGVMAARGAAGGFVVTSGRFTNEASQFASGRNVKLIDGAGLQTLLKAATLSVGQPKTAPAAPAKPAVPATGEGRAAMTCPRCQQRMVQRVARQGANAGQPFWGCVAYPACRGTRPL